MVVMHEPAPPPPSGPALLAEWIRVDPSKRRREILYQTGRSSVSLGNWLRGDVCPTKYAREMLRALTGIPSLADRASWGGSDVSEDAPTAEQIAAAVIAGEKLAAEARS